MATKMYVLDTNVLMGAPDAIYGFDDNVVVLPSTVLQELDKHKTDPGEAGFNTRTAIRTLDDITSDEMAKQVIDGSECYEINDVGGMLKMFAGTATDLLPIEYDMGKPDNKILNDVCYLRDHNAIPVILVTNDVSMRVNARNLNIEVQPYRNVRVAADKYTGRSELILSYDAIAVLKDNLKNPDSDGVDMPDGDGEYHENEYFVIHAVDKENQMVAQYHDGKLYGVNFANLNPYGVKARNVGQSFALHALTRPVDEIPLVILEGRAGTAKTFLSIAAGLDAVYDCKGRRTVGYSKLVYTRPNQLSDNDHGYLKGTLFEKMQPLLGPAFDNLEALIAGETHEDSEQVRMHVEDLFETGIIEALSMAYMRGRSISNAYIIVDEAQNCTRGQIYDIVSRAGDNTKVVLCGDSNQVDNPALDKYNNGLSFAIERMKDSVLCSQITFNGTTECVRSALAAEATMRLAK